jgi:hypothetical protein
MPLLETIGSGSARSFGLNSFGLPPDGLIVTSGLILNLDAGNPSSYSGSGTTWTDLSGNGLNATLYGTSFDTENRGSIVFDRSAADEGAQINSSSLFNLSTFTISSWNKPNVTNHNGFLFEKTIGGSVNTQYSLFYNSSNDLYFRTIRSTGGYGDLTVPLIDTIILNNTWVNITATYNNGAMAIYINGVLKSSSSTSNNIVTGTGPSYIGVFGERANYLFDGRIAMTHVYNRALSQSEVTENFNARKMRFNIL